jgi:acetyl-CoA carboxylase biotin carboxyl carrier protein
MKIEEVRKLIRLVEESNIGELEVRKWWGAIRISRSSASSNGVVVSGHVPAELARMAPAPAAGPAKSGSVESDADRKAAADTSGLTPVTSPMVGSFYRAPAPDADPYVEPGDRIEPGQTLCIIEAMKLMNEIQSEVRGKVVKVLVSNSQPVEFGQTLFLVDESA